jgi:hypothetical protein
MRTLKKIAAGLLAAALAVGLLTACSNNKVTGTAKSWGLSNTGKVLEKGGAQTLLTYEVNGTEKYIVVGKADFIGSKKYGVQQGSSGQIRYLVNSVTKTQEADNDRSGTKYQPDEVDIPLWILMRDGTDSYWLLAGKNAYNEKMYYTEAFKLSVQAGSNGDWLSDYGERNTVYSYEYVLYYESEDDAMPAFIRINGEGLKDAIVPVKDFQSVEYSQTVPAPYDGLVDRTSYKDGTVTK